MKREKTEFRFTTPVNSILEFSKAYMGDFGIHPLLFDAVYEGAELDSYCLNTNHFSSFRQTVFFRVRGSECINGKSAGIRIYAKNSNRALDLNFKGLSPEHERIMKELKKNGIKETQGHNINGEITALA